MSSDGRYGIYPHQQGMNTSYDYASYPSHPHPPPPPPPYDNSQIAQPPLRTMRTTASSQPHSPPQQPQYAPPSSSYPPNYASGPYMAQPPPHPQWTSENWAHYNQSYPPPQPAPPPAPAAEGAYNSGPGRPDPPVPSTSAEPRGYAPPPPPPNSDSRRMDERPAPPPNPPPAVPPKTRRREKESPPAATSPGTPTGLDFMKLLESYRLIIDGSEAITASGVMGRAPPPPSETLERMIQNATLGVQILESAAASAVQQPTPTSEARSPKERESEDSKEPLSTNDNSALVKRQKTDDAVQEGQTCLGCNATSTPEWRRGPMGPRTLCNACGLVYAKLIKKRVRESNRLAGKANGRDSGHGGMGDDASAGDGDSDDDDEDGSQDRRSDGGDGGRD